MNETLPREYARDDYDWLSANAELLERGEATVMDAEHMAEALAGADATKEG